LTVFQTSKGAYLQANHNPLRFADTIEE
jgi:hypothetical protein